MHIDCFEAIFPHRVCWCPLSLDTVRIAFSYLVSNAALVSTVLFPETHALIPDNLCTFVHITIHALSKAYIAQVGWLSEGYRFSRKQGSWLPSLEHRAGEEAKQIGSFTYDFSKGNLQTIAVDSQHCGGPYSLSGVHVCPSF